MPPEGFELTISADEWPKTYTLDRAVTGAGPLPVYYTEIKHNIWTVLNF
jgi:hypothetical protein